MPISDLYTGGKYGWALDVLDPTKLWQDSNGSQTTAAANGQPIGRIDDVSGNNNHFIVEGNNDSRRAVYDAADADECPIDFDGSNDALVVAAVGLFAAAGCTIVARIKGAGAQNRHFFCEGGTANSNVCYAAGLSTQNVAADAGGRYFIANDAGSTTLNVGSGAAVFDNAVHTVVIEDTGSAILMTVDGVAGTSRSYTRSGSYTLAKTVLGALYRNAVQSAKSASMGRIAAIVGTVSQGTLSSADRTTMIDWVENNTSGTVNLSISNVTISSPAIDAVTLGQKHALSISNYGPASVDIAAVSFGQKAVLTISDVNISSPAIGSPGVGIKSVFSIPNFAVGSPAIGTPTLGQKHALTIANFIPTAPVLGPPALVQKHALSISNFATASPVTGPVNLGSEGTDAFTISPVEIGSPVIGPVNFSQKHSLTISSVTIGSPIIGGVLFGQKHQLSIPAFATASPSIGTPAFAESPIVGPLQQENILAAENEDRIFDAALEIRFESSDVEMRVLS